LLCRVDKTSGNTAAINPVEENMLFKKRTPQPVQSVAKSLQDVPASANHEVAEVKKEETVAERLTRAGHVCAPLVGSVTRGACRLICGRVFAIDYSRDPILKDNCNLQEAKYPSQREEREETRDERLIRAGHVVAPLIKNANKPCSPYVIINGKLYKIDYSKERVLSYFD
jgi:biotin carboxyl carrier protein